MNTFEKDGPPVDIYEDGIYYYVFFPSDDSTCLELSPWGNNYGWIEKLNPSIWTMNNLGSKILFSNCPIGVKKAIMKEWKHQ